MAETWVDAPRNEMPLPNTWDSLSFNGLLDVKNQVLDKIHTARGNQMYLKALNDALARLDGLIAVKLADPRGAA
jgi:hypothetical protein